MRYLTLLNRSVLCLLVTLFFLLHVVGKIEIPLLDKIEHSVYDLRLQLTMPNTLDPRIVIIDIDEISLANEGRWPWSRDKLSYLVDILFDYYQISVLGFDIVFAEPDTSSGIGLLEKLEQNQLSNNEQFKQVAQQLIPALDFDQLFADSLKDRAVVLSYYFNNKESNPNSSLPLAADNTSHYPQLRLVTETGFGANLNSLQKAAIYGGYFNNSRVDSDGSYRRLPLISNFNGNIYETLSLAIYRRLLDQPPLELNFEQGYGEAARLESINIESLSIPVDQHAIALVPYRGKQGSFSYISASDVLNGKVDPEQLTNKIVLFGTTAAGLLDLRTTPVQKVYPGVEVHANMLSGMLDDNFKSKPSYMLGAEFFELLLIALIVIFLYPRLTSVSSLIVFSLLIAAMFWLNITLWQQHNIDNFLATPLILLFLLFSIQLYFGYFLETKKKNQLGKIFGQYIPAELVADMSQSEHDYSLKGESKQMTVLFSDVRGFTSISEDRNPEELCELINEILTPITHVIHHHQGTIDKYIGDAVMAFWGAPLEDNNHAYHAVTAALQFAPVLDTINHAFQQKKWPHIDIGIGINTGAMNVGNMGSEFRMAYTVMGDAVNLGSRLEGLTKEYGVRIIVSESTKKAAPEFSYLELDRVRVKGKDKPVSIYQPLCLTDELSSADKQMLTDFDTALALYLQRQWSEAEAILHTLKLTHPDKFIFTLYLSRIDEYKQTPPTADWDGVFTHLTK